MNFLKFIIFFTLKEFSLAKLIVSLGSNCYVSWTLRKIGLQFESMPLDWVNSFSIQGVNLFLEELSAHFINNLKPCFSTGEENDRNILSSDKYNFRMPHEYDLNPERSLFDIYDTYKMRIERFRTEIVNNEVIFVRKLHDKSYNGVKRENFSTRLPENYRSFRENSRP